MSQTDYQLPAVNVNNAISGLDIMNRLKQIFQAYNSLNSGNTEPTTPYSLMLWADTSVGYLKVRSNDNTYWNILGKLGSDSVFCDYNNLITVNSTAPVTTYPLMLWGDTTNNLLKYRNVDNTGWVDLGVLNSDNPFGSNYINLINVSSVEPILPYNYMLWGDTTNNLLKWYNPSTRAWVIIGDINNDNPFGNTVTSVYYNVLPPDNPVPLQLWANLTTNKLNYRNFNNNGWVELGDIDTEDIFSYNFDNLIEVSATEPINTYPLKLWADTTNNVLKFRTYANTGWNVLNGFDNNEIFGYPSLSITTTDQNISNYNRCTIACFIT